MTKEIIVNRTEDTEIFPIVPLNVKRKWMNDTRQKFAYKCLPLNIANQYGFAVLSPSDFTIDWWGGKGSGEVDIQVFSDNQRIVDGFQNYFGEATFTLHLDFVIQTPEGYSTYIRGIPNELKHGIKPLDAIVETDWLPYTFTYNFVVTEPGVYHFKKGEPLFAFFPIERNTVENFKLKTISMKDNKDFHTDFKEYEKARFNLVNYETKDKPLFQKFYINGRGPTKKYKIKNHITNLLFGGGRATKNNDED